MTAADRRAAIFAAGSLPALLDQPGGRALLEDEAADAANPDRLLDPDQLRHLLAVRRGAGAARLGLLSTDDVFLVPGFMGSTLRDTGPKDRLIWIDPLLWKGQRGERLADLELAPFRPNMPDLDAIDGVRVAAGGDIPAVYDLLSLDLEFRRYDVQAVGFDWRKDLEREAEKLADRIRGRLGRRPRPLHLVAHSQGNLVARRAIQLLGPDQARRLVNTMVLLAPACYGTFSAAAAVAGTHGLIGTLRDLWVQIPENLQGVLKTFTGLYQLLPWKPGTVADGFDPADLKSPGFWRGLADADRLAYGFGWGAKIDTDFFNDRTAVILGDQPATVGAVGFGTDGKLVGTADVAGDGTVPHLCSLLPGVRSYLAAGAEHMTVPLSRAAIGAVAALLRGDTPRVRTDGRLAAGADAPSRALAALKVSPPIRLAEPAKVPAAAAGREEVRASGATVGGAAEVTVERAATAAPRPDVPAPPCRRLRVFSFDPLLATRLPDLDIAEITIPVRWETGDVLSAGPVGEYLEVIDRDPSSGCFYHPVDLRDERLTAQDGLPAAESDPRFHQQMVYAVAMSTIDTFEKALGRVALWAPRLPVDDDGELIDLPEEARYVPRLRVYPHALREANAYYDPDRHALLFGYFSSREAPGGETLPGGTVFTCLSFDIVAHETTHALLHGLHRYYLHASNPDVFAFHEAFADAVAVFQHFSHTDVVRHQVARSRGELAKGGLLGNLAVQFGNALGGHRGALRKYIGLDPKPALFRTVAEPHDRGAILMAALFRAFLNIYDARSADLKRIATAGTGRLPDGDLHPDLVNRLAREAAKSARHLLTMIVRALDYLPPVDPTYGEFLRAVVTADYDLVRDDDLGYRPAVLNAFREWGIYPAGVTVLDEAAVRWRPPPVHSMDSLRAVVKQLSFEKWTLRAGRKDVYLEQQANALTARGWLYTNAREMGDGGAALGLMVFGKGFHSVPRNRRNAPKFEVHSVRPCRRIGPDGQQRVDLVAEVVQRRAGYLDEAYQAMIDAADTPWAFGPAEFERYKQLGKERPLARTPDFWFRGGCTLLIDPETGQIRYCIRKSVRNDDRLADQRAFERTGALPSNADTYFGSRGRTPFAALHADH